MIDTTHVNDAIPIALIVIPYVLLIFVAIVGGKIFWGNMMKSKWERDEQVKRIWADIITDGATAARLKDEDDPDFLSTKEAHEWLTRFGHILSIKDLVPKNEEMLKDRLQKKFPVELSPEIAATSPLNKSLNGKAPITSDVPAPPTLLDQLQAQ